MFVKGAGRSGGLYCSVGAILKGCDGFYRLVETRGGRNDGAGFGGGDRREMVGQLHIFFPSAFK